MKKYWKTLLDTFVKLEWDKDNLEPLSKQEQRLWENLKKEIPEAYRNAKNEQI